MSKMQRMQSEGLTVQNLARKGVGYLWNGQRMLTEVFAGLKMAGGLLQI
jgi:hypothetical protein